MRYFTAFSIIGLLSFILILLVIRIVIAYFIAKRGNLILSAKGYASPKLHVYSLSLFLTVFFGVVLAYTFVFWYASAFPVIRATSNVNAYTEDTEDEE